jgi:hypothetical protein
MGTDYDKLIRELQAFVPSDHPLQLHVMELARVIHHQKTQVQKLQLVIEEALAALKRFPEEALGRTSCPGGGLSSNLYDLIAELQRKSRISPP